MDQPNYFEATELSSGAVLLELLHCRSTMARAVAPLAQDAGADPKEVKARTDTYCECVADAFRQNYRRASQGPTAAATAGDHLATKEQMMTCMPQVNGLKATKPSGDSAHGTVGRIDELDLECRRTAVADDYLTVYCTCHVDMIVSGREQPGGAKRCAIAARHRVATQQHLTARQFHAIEPEKD